MSWLLRPQEVRFKYAISGAVGANGSGKSFVVAGDTMADLDDGIPVLSTMRFLDWRNPRPCDDVSCGCDKSMPNRHRAAHPLYTPWEEWDQFMDWTFGVVVADEILGVAASGATVSELPRRVRKKMQKMRHTDLIFRWTAPAWARAEITLREITQLVTVCHGAWKVPAEDPRRRWRQARQIIAESYLVEDAVDFRTAARDKLEMVAREKIWVPKSDTRFAYDTFDRVFEISRSDDGGRCDECGHQIRKQYCKCDHSGTDAGEDAPRSSLASEDAASPGAVPPALRVHASQFGPGSLPTRVVEPEKTLVDAGPILPAERRNARRNGRPYPR